VWCVEVPRNALTSSLVSEKSLMALLPGHPEAMKMNPIAVPASSSPDRIFTPALTLGNSHAGLAPLTNGRAC
jgi:hypothetical protein